MFIPNNKKTLLESVKLALVIAIMVTLVGCGTLTGIPSHGGGKRFAIEQRLVSTTVRGAIKEIDLSELRGKTVFLQITSINDQGAGNMVGGRASAIFALQGITESSPVTSIKNTFKVFDLSSSGGTTTTQNTVGGSNTSTRTFNDLETTASSSTNTSTNTSGSNTATSNGTNMSTTDGSSTNDGTSTGMSVSNGENTNTSTTNGSNMGMSTTNIDSTTNSSGTNDSVTTVDNTSVSNGGSTVDSDGTIDTTTTTGATVTTQVGTNTNDTTTTNNNTTNTDGTSTVDGESTSTSTLDGTNVTNTNGTNMSTTDGSGTNTNTTNTTGETSNVGTSTSTTDGTTTDVTNASNVQNTNTSSTTNSSSSQSSRGGSDTNNSNFQNTVITSGTNGSQQVLANQAEETRTQTKGTGYRATYGVDYRGQGAYSNFNVPVSDVGILQSIIRTYFYLNDVKVTTDPNNPAIDAIVNINVDVFGSIRSRLDTVVYNKESVKVQTVLEVMAINYLDHTLMMVPQTGSYEAIYDEKYAFWIGPLNRGSKRIKHHSMAQPMLVSFDDVAAAKMERDRLAMQQGARLPAQPQPPAVAPSANASTAIAQSIAAWLKAWETGDVAAYLNAYSPAFIPQQGISVARWKRERTNKLTNANNIRVVLKNAQINVAPNQSQAKITFIQDYTSSNYQDSMVKTLELENVGGQWKILKEYGEQ